MRFILIYILKNASQKNNYRSALYIIIRLNRNFPSPLAGEGGRRPERGCLIIMRTILFLFILFFTVLPFAIFEARVYAHDLGIYGETQEIAEKDIRSVIYSQAKTLSFQKLERELQNNLYRQAQEIGEHLPKTYLPEARVNQIIFINPSIKLKHNISYHGKVFYPKNTWINPLSKIRPISHLLFFNPESRAQKKWAIKALKLNPAELVLIATQGNPVKLSTELNYPVYYAFPGILHRFHVQATPTLVKPGERGGGHENELEITSLAKPYSSYLLSKNLSKNKSFYNNNPIYKNPVHNDSNCKGRLLNPLTDINWNMVFPIRIGGIKARVSRSSVDSAATLKSSLCVCPSPHGFHLPIPGILVSYHQPLYIEEIAKTPGCLSSLGGLSILKGYENLQTDLKQDENNAARWQVHWYYYPILSLLDIFKDFSCEGSNNNPKKFSLAYLTELDPTWQDDTWSVIYNPEAALFSNPSAQAACMADARAATASHPIDSLFWCAGSWGPMYPLTGNANASVEHIQSANLVAAKMLAKLAKMGILRSRVGSRAMCKNQPMPVLIKSEFSLDPVYPRVSNEGGLPIGASTTVWECAPPQSYPGYENINQVIFQEQQCCLRF